MDLSDQWRSLWPISSVFSAPNLLSAAAAEFAGPLLFRPSQPPLVLLSCPSLVLNIPPSLSPSSFVHGLHASLRSLDNDSFLPAAAADALAADILSSLPPFAPLSPNLHSLLSPNVETLILFFPTGENAHSIGFLSLSFKSGSPDPRLDTNGGTFKQKDGFKHPYHRILKISVVATSAAVGPKPSGNSIVEGMLVAATMYSVNWFRVESRVLDSGEERRFVVPVAKQGFERSVVHACWSPHFPEESAVLLDDGELFWFNLNTQRGGKVRVVVGSDDPVGNMHNSGGGICIIPKG